MVGCCGGQKCNSQGVRGAGIRDGTGSWCHSCRVWCGLGVVVVVELRGCEGEIGKAQWIRGGGCQYC